MINFKVFDDGIPGFTQQDKCARNLIAAVISSAMKDLERLRDIERLSPRFHSNIIRRGVSARNWVANKFTRNPPALPFAEACRLLDLDPKTVIVELVAQKLLPTEMAGADSEPATAAKLLQEQINRIVSNKQQETEPQPAAIVTDALPVKCEPIV